MNEKESGESLPVNHGAIKERATWVGQQLGEGWTEVEPGIYRFTHGDMNEDWDPPSPRAETAAEGRT